MMKEKVLSKRYPFQLDYLICNYTKSSTLQKHMGIHMVDDKFKLSACLITAYLRVCLF